MQHAIPGRAPAYTLPAGAIENYTTCVCLTLLLLLLLLHANGVLRRQEQQELKISQCSQSANQPETLLFFVRVVSLSLCFGA